MDSRVIVTCDFETEAIVGNPLLNPPKPVGLAVWVPGQEPEYMAWGHPTENNCTWDVAHKYLKKLKDSGCELLFHNDGFDLSVWEYYFCNAMFRWDLSDCWRRFHDTMYLLFLNDPYANTLSLKPSADRYLGMAPQEQDELKNWILANVPEATPTTFGAYIARAPGDLVGRYAIGDVVRTRRLFDLLYPKIVEQGMEAAYDRDRKLFPIMMRGTKHGIRLDRDTLQHHTNVYTSCLEIATERLAQRLGCAISDLDHDESFADALESSGAVTEWVLTEKARKRSLARDNLKICIPEVKTLIDYRGALSTCLNVFMNPWLDLSRSDGRLHPNWNQVKQAREMDRGKKNKGTKTGRLSSDSPNFQNVPTEFITPTGDSLSVPEGLHPLPQLRRYILPEEGHVWLKRDFSSQELRILAHFEDGQLCTAYRLNPNLDVHQMARELIQSIIGILYARKDIKITGFSLIYGSGVTGLSGQLGRPYHEAYQIRASYLAALPGVKDLMDDVQARGKAGQPIRTWGGRIYYVEPSKTVNGRWMDFAYKLLNYLIQGSAADQTKESINDWWDARLGPEVFMATVHDEVNISAPKDRAVECMRILRECMNKDRFDVPVLSEGFIGPNWADLESCA
jgi:DNA polymerase I-like protein with 3'-5' exonuclease and polymerase domains